MENPYKWIEDFKDYIQEDAAGLSYGSFCTLRDNAPDKAEESYRKYIKLCSHILPSLDDVIIENREIKGFRNNADLAVQKQNDIIMELIEKGIIDRRI